MDEERKKNRQRPTPFRRGPLLRTALWAALAVCVCGALWMTFTIFSPAPIPPRMQKQPSINASETVRPAEPQQFEETPTHGLEETIRQIDQIVLNTIRENGLDSSAVDILSVDRRHNGHGDYFHQVIRLNVPEDSGEPDMRSGVISALNATLATNFPRTRMVPGEYGQWRILVNDLPTHELLFSQPAHLLPPRAALAKGPKLAIVIDDMGENMVLAQRLAALDVPITFAIWPRASHTAATSELARQKGMEILIHQPMEPLSYPDANPGPGALFVSMPGPEIQAIVAENIALVPGATGMNNHMGSRFTEDAEGMDLVFQILRQHGLFFLDSATTPRSAVQTVARQMDMPYIRRQIFLDNLAETDAIRHQLEKVEKLALLHGQAIAIGHPHPETVQAIEEWLPTMNGTVQLVRVGDLLPRSLPLPKKVQEAVPGN